MLSKCEINCNKSSRSLFKTTAVFGQVPDFRLATKL